MRIIGIDPGTSGGMALLDDGKLTVWDLPVKSVGTTMQIDAVELANMLSGWVKGPDAIVVEDNRANGQNGSLANFSMGLSMGVILGVIGALGHPLVRVKPQAWKQTVGLTSVKGSTATQRKHAARHRALELWPGHPGLQQAKDHNRADAALIAEAYRRGL